MQLNGSIRPLLQDPTDSEQDLAHQHFRVILADDDQASGQLLKYLLEKWGFDVHLVSNGVEAWELLQAADVPTIAILDRNMPGLDGLQVCRRVKALSRSHYTYVMLLSANHGSEFVIEGLSCGADDYVSKP